MKHRSRIEITSLILEITSGGGVRKTKIMKQANLSYIQLKQHLMFLTDKDLIYYDKETQTFKTTEEGLRFLHIYHEIEDMLNKLPIAPQKRQREKVGQRRV